MTCVVWAQELHAVTQKVTSVIEKLSVEKDEDAIIEREKLQAICQVLKSASRDVWQANDRLFETKYVDRIYAVERMLTLPGIPDKAKTPSKLQSLWRGAVLYNPLSILFYALLAYQWIHLWSLFARKL